MIVVIPILDADAETWKQGFRIVPSHILSSGERGCFPVFEGNHGHSIKRAWRASCKPAQEAREPRLFAMFAILTVLLVLAFSRITVAGAQGELVEAASGLFKVKTRPNYAQHMIYYMIQG